MAEDKTKIYGGLNIEEGDAGTTQGDLRVDSSGDLKYHDASSEKTVASTADITTHAALTSTHGVSGAIVGTSDTQTLTSKTIDSDNNTITNIANADIKAGAAIDATKIHDGSVDNTEFGYLNGVTSSIQTQLNAKQGALSGLTDNTVIRANGTTDIQGSGVTVDDSNNITTAGNVTITGSGANTLNGTISGTAIKDEDNMASDSASHLATQQSIKAYVDAEVASASGGFTTTSKTTTYTAVSGDFVLADASGGAFTVTLPAAASNSNARIVIKKTDDSTNAVTVDGNASETIDGKTTLDLEFEDDSVTLISDGTNWQVQSVKRVTPRSEVSVYTASGYGSTATRIVYFATTETSVGDAITYNSSSTNGDNFTINDGGLYAIMAQVVSTDTDREYAITKNQTTLTANPDVHAISEIILAEYAGSTNASNRYSSVTAVEYLDKNDVIRVNVDGGALSTTAGDCRFKIVKIL